MAIYEKYTGRSRDSFSSYEDLYKNYKITYNEDFNFAYDVLDYLGREKPDKRCMVWVGDDGSEKSFTFSEMSRYSNKAANFFKSLGIEKGDFVLLVLKRSYNFWFCMMGLSKIGAIPIPAPHLLVANDYIYRCNSGDVKMVVITGDNDCTRHFDEAMPQCYTVKHKAVTKGKDAGADWIDFDAGLEAASEEWERVPTKASDTMAMLFSSGTTGYPKMVKQDYTYALGHLMTGVFWHRAIDGGLHFTISDTGWGKSLWGKLYGQWLAESAVFVYDFERFNAASILKMIEKYKITTFCAPPTMYRLILNEDVKSYDLSSLQHCTAAGEALNPEIFNEWKKFTGLGIHDGFGQTETTLACSTLYPWTTPTPGSIGLPTPGYDLFIADENDYEVAPGVTGEMCIRARREDKPNGLFTEYYKNADATSDSWHDDVYHTGDTAYRDERGRIWYVGRNDDIIKSSGYRIGPFEVESVLLEHPAVLETAVTGVPDPIRGFSVKATIVLRKGYEPSDELKKDLQNHVKRLTAPYKYPRVIEFTNELPKTTNGKIKRSDIRKRDLGSTK